jgi:hypothetical protein
MTQNPDSQVLHSSLARKWSDTTNKILKKKGNRNQVYVRDSISMTNIKILLT